MGNLPDVTIPILNNQLGRVDSVADRVPGLILFGPAPSGLALATAKQIFTLQEAVDLGITAAYDTTNITDVYKQIKEFYDAGNNGQELWIYIVAMATTMTTALDKTGSIAPAFLDAMQGRCTFLGCSRYPASGYTPTTADGLDDDVSAAVLKVDALQKQYQSQNTPFRWAIGARKFTPGTTLKNYRLNTNNGGVLILFSTSPTYNSVPYYQAAVGFYMGLVCKLPVQRKASRVKNGDVGLLNAYLTDGSTIESRLSLLDTLAGKGVIVLRKFTTKNGYFCSPDFTCVANSDDYSLLSRGFVIDKAQRIAYTTFVNELDDDIDVAEDGTISPAVAKSFQQKIINAISIGMANEISGVTCVINATQNILATDTVQITKLGVRPKGYASYINVPLGFNG